MSARKFKGEAQMVNGRPLRTFWIKCSACGADGNVGRQNLGERLASDLIPQKFEAKGWTVGRRPDDDLCPDCTTRQQTERRAKLTVVPSVVKAVAEPPREPSRDERRIIMESIRERYDERAGRYLDNWSDHLIATDLNVPKAWVSEIRDGFFGAEGANDEMTAVRNAIDGVEKGIRSVCDAAIDKIDSSADLAKTGVKTALATALKEIEVVRKRQEQINKAVGLK